MIRLIALLISGLLLITGVSCTKEEDSVTDIEGNSYHFITIGTKVWMKENLKVTRYRNGDLIGTTNPAAMDLLNDDEPKYQWAYEGNESNASTYGRLYTWYAVTDSRGLCPAGWHVPTREEWDNLTESLGGMDIAGGKMKEKGTIHWLDPNKGASDKYGFKALPGGVRSYRGQFSQIGYHGLWWSSTDFDINWAWGIVLDYDGTKITSGNINIKKHGYSVRCVMD